MKILIANVGSTSFKFQLFESENLSVLARGRLERIGHADAPVQYQVTGRDPIIRNVNLPDYAGAIRYSIGLLTDVTNGVVPDLSEISAVGFKPVHALNTIGCQAFTEDVLEVMEQAIPLAPAHNPPYISAVRLFKDLLPGLPLYGLFEPTFHQTIPAHARVYGIPFDWIEKYGIQRYGFHGASHAYIAERTPEVSGRDAKSMKIVSCHLGGSSSVCAIDGGRSVDTSMGLTPQSGLMQSTRNGDLDPFGVLYVMDQAKLTTDDMRTVLCKQSGLKGLSGIESGDMRDILEAAQNGNERAILAVDAFTYEIKKYIGAYGAAMGGLDAVVFTGGIGERSPRIRSRVCDGLNFLGLTLDKERNDRMETEGIISRHGSPVTAAVIPTDEERIIVREVANALKNN